MASTLGRMSHLLQRHPLDLPSEALPDLSDGEQSPINFRMTTLTPKPVAVCTACGCPYRTGDMPPTKPGSWHRCFDPRSREGATIRRVGLRGAALVSIRAPVKGRHPVTEVSIRAPVKGRLS